MIGGGIPGTVARLEAGGELTADIGTGASYAGANTALGRAGLGSIATGTVSYGGTGGDGDDTLQGDDYIEGGDGRDCFEWLEQAA